VKGSTSRAYLPFNGSPTAKAHKRPADIGLMSSLAHEGWDAIDDPGIGIALRIRLQDGEVYAELEFALRKGRPQKDLDLGIGWLHTENNRAYPWQSKGIMLSGVTATVCRPFLLL